MSEKELKLDLTDEELESAIESFLDLEKSKKDKMEKKEEIDTAEQAAANGGKDLIKKKDEKDEKKEDKEEKKDEKDAKKKDEKAEKANEEASEPALDEKGDEEAAPAKKKAPVKKDDEVEEKDEEEEEEEEKELPKQSKKAMKSMEEVEADLRKSLTVEFNQKLTDALDIINELVAMNKNLEEKVETLAKQPATVEKSVKTDLEAVEKSFGTAPEAPKMNKQQAMEVLIDLCRNGKIEVEDVSAFEATGYFTPRVNSVLKETK